MALEATIVELVAQAVKAVDTTKIEVADAGALVPVPQMPPDMVDSFARAKKSRG